MELLPPSLNPGKYGSHVAEGGFSRTLFQMPAKGGELGSNGIRIEIRRSSTTHRDIASRLCGFGVIVEDLLLKSEEVVETFEGCVEDHIVGEGWEKRGGLVASKCCEKNFSNGERMIRWRKAKIFSKRFLRRLKRKSERFRAVTFFICRPSNPVLGSSCRLRHHFLERRGQTSSTRNDVSRCFSFRSIYLQLFAAALLDSH
jgi:hypothetical protein